MAVNFKGLLKDKKTNGGWRNTTQKTKDRVTRTPQKIRSELRSSGMVSSSYSTSDICHITLVKNWVMIHE